MHFFVIDGEAKDESKRVKELGKSCTHLANEQ